MADAITPPELKRQILASAKRMLEQLDQIEVSQGSDLPPEFGEKSHELLEMISNLQTGESEHLLQDVSRWGEDRKRNYNGFEEPLLQQVESNQSITTEVTHESIPRMQTQMDTFQGKLDSAKSQLETMGRSMLKEGQRVAKGGASADFPAVPILQLESDSKAMLPDVYNMMRAKSDEDEAIIKQMKMREEHFMAAVQSLGKEVESLSAEVVEVRTYNLELEDEVKRLNGVINELQRKEALSLCPGRAMDVCMADAQKAIVSNLAFEVPLEGRDSVEECSAENGEEEGRRPTPVMEMRAIENFHFDIEPIDDDGDTEISVGRAGEALAKKKGTWTGGVDGEIRLGNKIEMVGLGDNANALMDGGNSERHIADQHDLVGGATRTGLSSLRKYAIAGEIVFESVDGKCRLVYGNETAADEKSDAVQKLGDDIANDIEQILRANAQGDGLNPVESIGSAILENDGEAPQDPTHGQTPQDPTHGPDVGDDISTLGQLNNPPDSKTGAAQEKLKSSSQTNKHKEPKDAHASSNHSGTKIHSSRPGHNAQNAVAREEGVRPILPIGIRQNENKGFRFIYRDNNDALIVDTEVKEQTKDGLFIINNDNDCQYPAVRVRDGFSWGSYGRLNNFGHNLALKPISRVESPPKAAASDFLAVHEERMKRIAHLKQTLVGLFEIGSDRPIDLGGAATRTAMRWCSFPVRPPPPIARALRNRATGRSIHVDPDRYPDRSPRALVNQNRPGIVRPKGSKYPSEPKSGRTKHIVLPLNAV